MSCTSADRRRAHGYSLVELLVVLAILGLLASMAMPLARMTQERERERELKRALWEIRDAIDAYGQARRSGALDTTPLAPGQSPYPPSLLALGVATPDHRPDHAGEVLRFLRRVPRDPFADPALPPEQTWGLRSYASEADRPVAGADVYDVHSLASGTALDGTALRDW